MADDQGTAEPLAATEVVNDGIIDLDAPATAEESRRVTKRRRPKPNPLATSRTVRKRPRRRNQRRTASESP
jgi:hypothetical protein